MDARTVWGVARQKRGFCHRRGYSPLRLRGVRPAGPALIIPPKCAEPKLMPSSVFDLDLVESTLISLSESFRETRNSSRFHVQKIAQTGHRHAHHALLVLENKSEPFALRQSAQLFCERLNLTDRLYVERS